MSLSTLSNPVTDTHAHSESAPPLAPAPRPTSPQSTTPPSLQCPPRSESPLDFSPTPEITSKILHDLADPTVSLLTIAEKAGTNLDALALWMIRPDIAERIAAMQSACAVRARLVATTHLPSVVTSISRIIDDFNYEESHVICRASDIHTREYLRRSRETTRRACWLLLRIARFYPVPQAARRSDRPTSESVGEPGCLCSVPASSQPRVSASPPPSLDSLLAQVNQVLPAITLPLCHPATSPLPSAPSTPGHLDTSTPSDAGAAAPTPPPEPEDTNHAHDQSASRGAPTCARASDFDPPSGRSNVATGAIGEADQPVVGAPESRPPPGRTNRAELAAANEHWP